MKQYEAVIETLEMLGGVATLGELNKEVFKIKDCEWRTKTPFASIRRIVQQTKGIYKIKPGLYGLEKYKKQLEGRGIITETDENKDSAEICKFNHTYYQGVLLIIGKYHNMQTFIPNQDKNKKFYNGQKLQELATLNEQPHYSYPQFIKRSSTIDTIWFNDRNMPDSPIMYRRHRMPLPLSCLSLPCGHCGPSRCGRSTAPEARRRQPTWQSVLLKVRCRTRLRLLVRSMRQKQHVHLGHVLHRRRRPTAPYRFYEDP